jgi:hypothetical protein
MPCVWFQRRHLGSSARLDELVIESGNLANHAFKLCLKVLERLGRFSRRRGEATAGCFEALA